MERDNGIINQLRRLVWLRYDLISLRLLNQLFEDELKIDMEYVKEIPRISLRKYRFVISEIPVEI